MSSRTSSHSGAVSPPTSCSPASGQRDIVPPPPLSHQPPSVEKRNFIIPNPKGLLARLQGYIEDEPAAGMYSVESEGGSDLKQRNSNSSRVNTATRLQASKRMILMSSGPKPVRGGRFRSDEMMLSEADDSSVYTDQVISVDLSQIFRSADIEIGDGDGGAFKLKHPCVVSSEEGADAVVGSDGVAQEMILFPTGGDFTTPQSGPTHVNSTTSNKYAYSGGPIHSKQPVFPSVPEHGPRMYTVGTSTMYSRASSPGGTPPITARDSVQQAAIQPNIVPIPSRTAASTAVDKRKSRGLDLLELGGRWQDAKFGSTGGQKRIFGKHDALLANVTPPTARRTLTADDEHDGGVAGGSLEARSALSDGGASGCLPEGFLHSQNSDNNCIIPIGNAVAAASSSSSSNKQTLQKMFATVDHPGFAASSSRPNKGVSSPLLSSPLLSTPLLSPPPLSAPPLSSPLPSGEGSPSISPSASPLPTGPVALASPSGRQGFSPSLRPINELQASLPNPASAEQLGASTPSHHVSELHTDITRTMTPRASPSLGQSMQKVGKRPARVSSSTAAEPSPRADRPHAGHAAVPSTANIRPLMVRTASSHGDSFFPWCCRSLSAIQVAPMPQRKDMPSDVSTNKTTHSLQLHL